MERKACDVICCFSSEFRTLADMAAVLHPCSILNVKIKYMDGLVLAVVILTFCNFLVKIPGHRSKLATIAGRSKISWLEI